MFRAIFPKGYNDLWNKEESDLEGGFSMKKKKKKSVADSWPSPGTHTFMPASSWLNLVTFLSFPPPPSQQLNVEVSWYVIGVVSSTA